jgi:hypothetical protein
LIPKVKPLLVTPTWAGNESGPGYPMYLLLYGKYGEEKSIFQNDHNTKISTHESL